MITNQTAKLRQLIEAYKNIRHTNFDSSSIIRGNQLILKKNKF